MATLGGLHAGLVAAVDVPLFVLASALAAGGVRYSAEVAAGWTVLVSAGMAIYATISGLAGWGALLMIVAAVCGVAALLLVRLGRLPSEWIVIGPFRARQAREAATRTHLLHTAVQIVLFWTLFLLILPTIIALVEHRWGLSIEFGLPLRVCGAVIFLAGSVLGLRSAALMARLGRGTPVPMATASVLVVAGPYRWVRNPMAIAGIGQGVAVGLMIGSWLVIVYALCGSLIWNHLVRPWEEKDLAERFGAPYEQYRDTVSCWVPRRQRPRQAGSAQTPLVY